MYNLKTGEVFWSILRDANNLMTATHWRKGETMEVIESSSPYPFIFRSSLIWFYFE
jgi:hypothetical protein